MACRVHPGTSVLEGREGSNILANWAVDIGGTEGKCSGEKAGEAEDILSAITSGRGCNDAIARARLRNLVTADGKYLTFLYKSTPIGYFFDGYHWISCLHC
jgi:hypothetical protein